MISGKTKHKHRGICYGRCSHSRLQATLLLATAVQGEQAAADPLPSLPAIPFLPDVGEHHPRGHPGLEGGVSLQVSPGVTQRLVWALPCLILPVLPLTCDSLGPG